MMSVYQCLFKLFTSLSHPSLCQDLTMFVNRISELVKHMVQQMGSLYSTEGWVDSPSTPYTWVWVELIARAGSALTLNLFIDSLDNWQHK